MVKKFINSNKYSIPVKIINLYNDMNISPENILREFALSTIYSKIDKYEAESNLFKRKYKCPYQQFKANVEAMDNEENFQWEDDLMDWDFAVENINYWQSKLLELKRG